MTPDQELELQIEDHYLRDNGLLDPGQPTRWAHVQYNRALSADFSRRERAAIRTMLGLIDGSHD